MRRFARMLICMVFTLSIWVGAGCDPSGPASGRDPVEDGEPDEIVIIGRGDDVVEVTGSYTAEEIQAILDNFRWDETAPWEETFSHGQPLLYYVELLAPSRASTDELTELGVPWDYLPLFDEEMPAMEGDIDVVMMEGIEAGRLVFAIITGESYNIIREEALAGNVAYPFVRKRLIPEEYRLSNGSLDPAVYIEAEYF